MSYPSTPEIKSEMGLTSLSPKATAASSDEFFSRQMLTRGGFSSFDDFTRLNNVQNSAQTGQLAFTDSNYNEISNNNPSNWNESGNSRYSYGLGGTNSIGMCPPPMSGGAGSNLSMNLSLNIPPEDGESNNRNYSYNYNYNIAPGDGDLNVLDNVNLDQVGLLPSYNNPMNEPSQPLSIVNSNSNGYNNRRSSLGGMSAYGVSVSPTNSIAASIGFSPITMTQGGLSKSLNNYGSSFGGPFTGLGSPPLESTSPVGEFLNNDYSKGKGDIQRQLQSHTQSQRIHKPHHHASSSYNSNHTAMNFLQSPELVTAAPIVPVSGNPIMASPPIDNPISLVSSSPNQAYTRAHTRVNSLSEPVKNPAQVKAELSPTSAYPNKPLATEKQTQAQIAAERRRRRRESHNAVEKRRRDNMNERIEELASLMPESFLYELGENGDYSDPLQHPMSQPANTSATSPTSSGCGSQNNPGGTLTTPPTVQAAAILIKPDFKPNKGTVLAKCVEYIQRVHSVIDEQNAQELQLRQLVNDLEERCGVAKTKFGETSALTSLKRWGIYHEPNIENVRLAPRGSGDDSTEGGFGFTSLDTNHEGSVESENENENENEFENENYDNAKPIKLEPGLSESTNPTNPKRPNSESSALNQSDSSRSLGSDNVTPQQMFSLDDVY